LVGGDLRDFGVEQLTKTNKSARSRAKEESTRKRNVAAMDVITVEGTDHASSGNRS
jgi:hypothetical protein